MTTPFNLESYLSHSGKVDLTDIVFDDAAKYPLTPEEIRCLTYMMDIETHTIVYLRGILNTCAVENPRITAFLSCWAYEEYFHGQALWQFLQACGVPVDPERFKEVQKNRSFREWLEDIGASLLCKVTKHFHSAYLTWGAINELSTLEGYGALIRKTNNPILAEILKRIIRDERKHFSFYYGEARNYLQHPGAQRLTAFLLKRLWTPVGSGVKPDSEVEWIMNFIFGEEGGRQTTQNIDAAIAKLPGLGWFDLVTKMRDR
ncbi:MAG: hypothetical protein HYU99_06845, partial [Deltaproteobacteria bacterium]|nr:hypothetical protein [Deltaproteobacteria bacterium]